MNALPDVHTASRGVFVQMSIPVIVLEVNPPHIDVKGLPI